MNFDSWIIITDERRVGGMVSLARALGGQVTAAVAGTSSLAASIAVMGFDKVFCFETGEGVAAEACAARIAAAAAEANPRLVLSSDMPVGRVLLGAVAAKLNAAVISSVRAITVDGDNIVVSRSTAEGKLLEDIDIPGALAGVFDGDDVETPAADSTPVEVVPVDNADATVKLIGTLEDEGEAGLLTASRVVSVGAGLAKKDDLSLIEELVEAVHAEMACSLPVCEDMRWLPASRVVGSSHNQVAPQLYLAVGISGQPQHLSGVRDAKIIVAVNNDPDARIFKHCDYGIVGDLYKIVPALIAAFKANDSTRSSN